MNTVDWNLITEAVNPNDSYNIFVDRFLKIYGEAFPLCKMTMKTKNLNSPWITKGIKKSSKKKQSLYKKFLKNKTTKRLETYKQYKIFFEKFEKRPKKLSN